MTDSSSPQNRRGIRTLGWVILLILVVIGSSAIRVILDWNNYNQGHRAYQQADCARAIRYFDRVIHSWRLADLGGFVAQAQLQEAECVPFQHAVEYQQAGKLSTALLAYMNFIGQYRTSILAEVARHRIATMFEYAAPTSLASQETCEQRDFIQKENLIAQQDTYLPPFYLACGQVYDQAQSAQKSFVMYKDLLTEYPAHTLAAEAEKLILANPYSCEKTKSIKESVIASRNDFMPSLYFHCGQSYAAAERELRSFDMYKALLIEYPDHSLAVEAEKSLLANPASCKESNALKNSVIAGRTDFMPSLYYQCGQVYDSAGSGQESFNMYKTLLMEYPGFSLAADVEKLLLASPYSCAEADSLRNSVIAERTDFMPSLYSQCGQTYEQNGDWDKAIAAYENFLSGYSSHSLAPAVEAGLARSIIAKSKTVSAGEIPAPERSGSTGSGLTEVVIQNHSPERLRIVFNGPESRVEELDACGTCTRYTLVGPAYCPADGPVGRYTLYPGQYDIVVEAIGNGEVTPWTANWSLLDGDQYSTCIYLITKLLP